MVLVIALAQILGYKLGIIPWEKIEFFLTSVLVIVPWFLNKLKKALYARYHQPQFGYFIDPVGSGKNYSPMFHFISNVVRIYRGDPEITFSHWLRPALHIAIPIIGATIFFSP
jgi:hypothetical protein